MARKVQYLGFAGRENLGDDVIREAFALRFPTVEFVDVPQDRRRLARRALPHLLVNRGRPLLLGGGTLIGRQDWRQVIDWSGRLFRPSAWEMMGLGVEDPDFQGSRTYTSSRELEQWVITLRRFRNVTVRGPRSRQILAEYGFHPTVVGDPALLLVGEPAPLDRRPTDVLVNLTCGEDQWGGLSTDWTPPVVAALRPLVKGGAQVEFVSMDSVDDRWNARVAEQLGLQTMSHRPRNHLEFFALASQAKIVLGTRLHCNVLSAACGTPTVSLEYRPKCRDFMRSIDAEGSTHRVDVLDPQALQTNLEQVSSGWAHAQRRTSIAVGELRKRLRAEIDAMAPSFGPSLERH